MRGYSRLKAAPTGGKQNREASLKSSRSQRNMSKRRLDSVIKSQDDDKVHYRCLFGTSGNNRALSPVQLLQGNVKFFPQR